MTDERHSKKVKGHDAEYRLLPKGSNAHGKRSIPTQNQRLTERTDKDESSDPKGPQSLQDIGILELLEQDSRPTFIIDLQGPSPAVQGRMNVVFSNKSLRFFDDLRNVVLAESFFPSPSPSTSSAVSSLDTNAIAEAEFKDWATCLSDFDSDGYLPRHTFRGMYWTCAALRHRWRVISASQVPHQRRQSHGTPRSSSRSTSRSTSSTREPLDPEEADLTKRLADEKSKFEVLTNLNPVGMYYLSPDGNIVYANDMCK